MIFKYLLFNLFYYFFIIDKRTQNFDDILIDNNIIIENFSSTSFKQNDIFFEPILALALKNIDENEIKYLILVN